MAEDRAAPEKPISQHLSNRDVLLRALYALSCSLSIFQIFWFNRGQQQLWRLSMGQIAGSALPAMEKKIGSGIGRIFKMSPGGAKFFARAFITKYYNQSFIGITHILAAPLWAAIIPFQLHPDMRKKFRRFHRALGTVFFALSVSLMAGFGAIMKRGLQLQPGALWAKGLEGLQRRQLPLILASLTHVVDPFLAISATWFSYTMIRSWLAAYRRRFGEHEEWVLRHVASGQWVSLMRILYGSVMMPVLMPRFGDTKLAQSNFFALSGIISFIACVTGAEVAVSRIKSHRVVRKPSAQPEAQQHMGA